MTRRPGTDAADPTASLEPEELPQANLRSLALAAALLLVLTLVAVLPAEYAIDPTGLGRILGLTPMGELKQKLAQAAEQEAKLSFDGPAKERTDSTVIRVPPAGSVEVKLAMTKGAKASFEWTAVGGTVSFETHVDKRRGGYHSYGKGENAGADKGTIVAVFNGYHGWYFKNDGPNEVSITLQTSGDYREVKQMQ
jgi:hypothetical protein